MNDAEILIENSNKIYKPIIEGEIVWETERCGMPGKLTFTVVNDKTFDFQEGNKIMLNCEGKGLFLGYVFQKMRDKNQLIKVIAYDQLRYLKNKDSYIYYNKKASDLLKMITGDFNLKTGLIEDSGYIIAAKIEDNKSLFDMILNAMDDTYRATGKLFLLYDNNGEICFTNVENRKVNSLIESDTAEDFKYQSSIDGNTYNKVKLIYEDRRKGIRQVHITKNDDSIQQWGVLQYFTYINDDVNGKALADEILKQKNKKRRNLTIVNALGNTKVRAGCLIPVNLILGDVDTKAYMIVEKCVHKFKNKEHFMDLFVRGLNIN